MVMVHKINLKTSQPTTCFYDIRFLKTHNYKLGFKLVKHFLTQMHGYFVTKNFFRFAITVGNNKLIS